MKAVSNKNNLDLLIKQCGELKEGTIRIASGWIRSRYLRDVLSPVVEKRIRSGKVALQVVFRIGEPSDLQITDNGVISYLESLAQHPQSKVEWKFSFKHHAKMYIVGDDWAMVGSFNLTGGGFGNESRPGSNPEGGLIVDSPQETAEVIQLFNDFWRDSISLDNRILGFTANESANDRFYVIGTEPLAAGRYVQLESDTNEVILAKIERSFRYNESFFYAAGEDFPDPEIFKQFAGRNTVQNRANGFACAGDGEGRQLNIAEVKPIHRVVQDNGGYRFEPVNIPPAVSSPVRTADPALLKSFFNPGQVDYAVLEENPDVAVSFDDEEILSKHFAVLGSTGSGKSWFVKQYLSCRLSRLVTEKGLRVIIVDTHGEYGSEQLFDNQQVEEILSKSDDNLKAEAVYLRDLDDIKGFFGSPDREEKSLLEKAFREADKSSGDREKVFLDNLKTALNRNPAREPNWEGILNDLAGNIDPEKKPTNKPLESKIFNYIMDSQALDGIQDSAEQTILKDRLKQDILITLKKYFPVKESDSSLLQDIYDRVSSGEFRLNTLNLVSRVTEPGIYRLNLAMINDMTTRQSIVGDLLQEVFEQTKTTPEKKRRPVLFIVDEAQNYAPEQSSRTIASYRWMKIIASEGRKFGTSLLVMTQRPQYLSKDVLTQCNSQAIFRLINKADIGQVENTVEGISEYDLHQLPNFVAGQAIFTGVGMKMPVRVKVKG